MDFLKFYFMLANDVLVLQLSKIHFTHLYFVTNRLQTKVGVETP